MPAIAQREAVKDALAWLERRDEARRQGDGALRDYRFQGKVGLDALRDLM